MTHAATTTTTLDSHARRPLPREPRPHLSPARRSIWLGTASAAAVLVGAFVVYDAGLLSRGVPVTLDAGSPSAEPVEERVARAPLPETLPAPASAPDSMARNDAIAADEFADLAPSAEVAPPAASSPEALAGKASQGMQLESARSRAPTGLVAAEPAIAPSRPVAENERHPDVEASGVVAVADQPVSTFSIDVDTASYSFVRDGLVEGRMPHPDAVRPEEMLNYFDYDLPLPDGDAPFSVAASVVDTPWNRGTRLVHIGLRAAVPEAGAAPRNLVFLVDTSGSMDAPDKLPLLKRAFRLLLTQLDPADEVAIVAYAGAAGTVLEPTSAAETGTILSALDALRSGGSTAGRDGLAAAYDLAGRMAGEGEGARIVLATDGDFNVGPSDPDALKRFVSARRDVASLSVLGFGRGNTNDALMQSIAQNGDGFAAHIDTDAEARRVLVDRVAGTLDTVARDVKIQVEFNPAAVSEYRLIGYETRALERADFNDDRVDAGEIGAGHRVVALYEVTPTGSDAELVDPLRYGGTASERAPTAETTDVADAEAPGELGFLRLRYKLPGESESRLIERPIAPDAADIPATETRFAAAVAAFADILRGAPAVARFDLADVETLAGASLGEDRDGARREFLSLVGLARIAE